MAITINSVTPTNNATSASGLTRKLKPYRFEADFDDQNPDLQKIVVKYLEWWEEADGTKRDLVHKSYVVQDDEVLTKFTDWYNQLGTTVILPAINNTLITL